MKIILHIQNLSKLLNVIQQYNIKIHHIFEIVFKNLKNGVFDYTIMTNTLLEIYDIELIYTVEDSRELLIHLNVLCSHIANSAIAHNFTTMDLVFTYKGGDDVLLQSRENINRY